MIDLAASVRPLFSLEPEELDRELRVEGSLPGWLRGSWYLNGPGRFRVGALDYRHWLDGDGAVVAVHFEPGRVRGVRRFVRSRKWEEEAAAGGALFRAFGTAFPGDRLLRGLGLESPVNVSVYPFAGRLLAFGEQGLPWSLDPVTLETLEEWTFGGSLNQISPLSAHPHFDPGSGEMVTFGVSFAATQPTLQLYRFGADGGLLRRDRVPLPMPASIHDFALSAGHAVFWVSPYLLDFRRMREGGSVMDSLEWCPEIGSRLLVVRRDDGQVVAEVPVGKGYSLHSINAYEPEPGRIVLDVIELDEPAYPSYVLDELLAAAPLGRPVRLEVDLERGLVVHRTSCHFDWAPDFPVIAPSSSGRRAEDVWMLGMSAARQPHRKFFDTLARVTWSQPGAVDRWQAPEGDFLVGEPAVVESPQGEEDLVLCPIFDAGTRHTRLVVFRAREIASGPIASVDFGTSFAPGFHGCWVPR